MQNISDTTSNWDVAFRNGLLSAFNRTKELLQTKLSDTEIIKGLNEIAESFYKELKDSPIPINLKEKDIVNKDSYKSVSIDLPYGCFKLPYFFYEVMKEEPSLYLEEEFARSLSWFELLGVINQKWFAIRTKLTKTDVLICKVLSRYTSKNQIHHYPLTVNMIMNRARQSLSIIEKTFTTLYERTIVTDLFLLNPWKLGWEIYLLSYSYNQDEKLREFDYCTISKEILLNNFCFRVIQIPSLKNTDEQNKIKKISNEISGNLIPINATKYNWELSQLEPREDKSYLKPPNFDHIPILQNEPAISFSPTNDSLNWIKNITKNGKKVDKTKSELKDIDFIGNKVKRVLNYFIQYGISINSFNQVAQNLEISDRDLSNIMQYLIKNNVISLGFRFRFIGAESEYAFIIENGTEEQYRTIQQILMQLPFSYFYEAESVLAGRVQLPNIWVHKFLEYFTRLQLVNKQLKIKLGQRQLGYSFFNPNIKIEKDYILNELLTNVN